MIALHAERGTCDSVAQGFRVCVATGFTPSFSADGRLLFFSVQHEEQGADLAYLDLGKPDAQPVVFLSTRARELATRLSPSGRLLAYQSDESGRDEIYLKMFPGGEGKWQVSINGGNWPRWNGKGDRLYYVEGSSIMEVEVRADHPLQLGTPQRLFDFEPVPAWLPFGWPIGFDVSRDGERFLLVQSPTSGPGMSQPKLVVVENWIAEFERN